MLTMARVQGKRGKVNSNLKERRRNVNINEAFKSLQGRIPNTPSPTQTPLPKVEPFLVAIYLGSQFGLVTQIKTLRLAISYIRELEGVLNGGSSGADLGQLNAAFAEAVAAELQTRNSYKTRAERLLQVRSLLISLPPAGRVGVGRVPLGRAAPRQ